MCGRHSQPLRHRYGALDPDTARPIFAAVLRGATHMAACGLAHRDIKLENVLLFERGRVALSDFGMACDAGARVRGRALVLRHTFVYIDAASAVPRVWRLA